MYPVLFLIALAYLLLMWNYARGWRTCMQVEVKAPSVSHLAVLVPARNEAQRIEACLKSIDSQKGLEGVNVDVILIDDYSTDHTAQIVQHFIKTRRPSQHISFTYLHLSAYGKLQSGELAFKKRALEFGISQTSAPLIVTTDADCTASAHWLRTVLSVFSDPEVMITTAPVLYHTDQRVFSRFQALDIAGTMGITAAGIEQGWQYLANGANLAFRADAWRAVGGYRAHMGFASGDDMFLMQSIVRAHPKSARFVKHPEAAVYTFGEPTMRGFVAQRLRWGAKNSAYKIWKVQAALGIAWLMCIAILITGLIACVTLSASWLVISLLMLTVKAAADWPILRATTRYFGQPYLMRVFLPALFLHTGYVGVVGTMSLFLRRFTWKGRDVR